MGLSVLGSERLSFRVNHAVPRRVGPPSPLSEFCSREEKGIFRSKIGLTSTAVFRLIAKDDADFLFPHNISELFVSEVYSFTPVSRVLIAQAY